VNAALQSEVVARV